MQIDSAMETQIVSQAMDQTHQQSVNNDPQARMVDEQTVTANAVDKSFEYLNTSGELNQHTASIEAQQSLMSVYYDGLGSVIDGHY